MTAQESPIGVVSSTDSTGIPRCAAIIPVAISRFFPFCSAMTKSFLARDHGSSPRIWVYRKKSNAHDNGDYNRALHGALQEEAGDTFCEVVTGGVEVGRAGVLQRSFNALSYDEACLVHQLLVVAQVYEATRDDV